MARLLVWIGLFAFVEFAAQASPILITTCSVGGHSGACIGPATAGGAYSFPALNSFTLSVFSSASSIQSGGMFAEATANLAHDFAAAGPVRAGKMHVIGLAQADSGGGPGSGGGASGSFAAPAGIACGRSFDPPCFQNLILDVLLGTPMHASVSSYSQFFGPASGGGGASLTIELFESDGETPVEIIDVAEVPEVGTGGLAFGGLMIVLVGRLLSKRRIS